MSYELTYMADLSTVQQVLSWQMAASHRQAVFLQ